MEARRRDRWAAVGTVTIDTESVEPGADRSGEKLNVMSCNDDDMVGIRLGEFPARKRKQQL